jgi:3'(2'), 5'-bisphosphate nucleotidase
MEINYRTLCKTVIEAAVKAGIEILDVYDSDFEVDYKSDSSPLTLADQKANEVIVGFLEKTNIPILSEEGKHLPYEARKNWRKLWIVDPLDGTKEFVKRNGEFTVNIALVENGVPTLGVIFCPVLGDLYFTDADAKKSYKLRLPTDWKENLPEFEWILNTAIELPLTEKGNTFTIAASRSHLNDDTKSFIDKIEAIFGKAEFVSKGSSLKLCLVAEGEAQVYPRYAPTSEWDTAAGHAIVNYSGASVLKQDLQNPIEYNKADILNPYFVVIRNELISLIKS